jgi:hypothetical protein
MDWEEAQETAQDFIKKLDTEALSDFVGSAKNLAFSLQDNRLLDHEGEHLKTRQCAVCNTAPRQPAGAPAARSSRAVGGRS